MTKNKYAVTLKFNMISGSHLPDRVALITANSPQNARQEAIKHAHKNFKFEWVKIKDIKQLC